MNALPSIDQKIQVHLSFPQCLTTQFVFLLKSKDFVKMPLKTTVPWKKKKSKNQVLCTISLLIPIF